MSVAELWARFLEDRHAWPKIVTAVTAGAVGVWSWATNKPDEKTGEKSMLKSVVTLGALTTGAALGVSALTNGSIRETIQSAQESGGWKRTIQATRHALHKSPDVSA